MKKLIILLGLLAITACNTIEGAGEDIERGGEKLQETSREVKHDMK